MRVCAGSVRVFAGSAIYTAGAGRVRVLLGKCGAGAGQFYKMGAGAGRERVKSLRGGAGAVRIFRPAQGSSKYNI